MESFVNLCRRIVFYPFLILRESVGMNIVITLMIFSAPLLDTHPVCGIIGLAIVGPCQNLRCQIPQLFLSKCRK